MIGAFGGRKTIDRQAVSGRFKRRQRHPLQQRSGNEEIRAPDPILRTLGWTRDDGIQYLEAHTRVSEPRAAVPVDRYPVWPAQGLSYALGRLEIRRLRSLAEQAFGSKFDVKAFHDRLLQDGAIPLPMLREQIERWLGGPR